MNRGDVFDVVIVGAGPAGSNAASVLLQSGLTVAQFDRSKFPRVKPCAGGLTIKACNALRFPLDPNVRLSAKTIQCNIWNKQTNEFSSNAVILNMIFRPEFDNALVEQNRKKDGFYFFDDEQVRDISYADGLFKVEAKTKVLCARQLIGADGANGFVNRRFKISRPRAFAIAVEVVLNKTSSLSSVPCLDFGVIEEGYGWIFPKDDHWSVGLYTLKRGTKNLREKLADYIRAKGFTVCGDPLETFEAHIIPIGGFGLRAPKEPVYLVGDAAGLADALLGEGIYYALESGRLAGLTASKAAQGCVTHHEYYRRLWRSVLPDTMITYYASKLFYRNVAIGIKLFKNPFLWRPFLYGYTQGATFTQCIIRGILYFVESLGQIALRSS